MNATYLPSLVAEYYRVGLWGRRLVLLPDLDGLVALCGDHAEATTVEFDIEDASLTGEGPCLHCGLDVLEHVPATPVVELEGPVVSSTDQNVICIQG